MIPKKIETLQDVKCMLLTMESQFPVETWKVNSIAVWPYIRIKLYIHFLSRLNTTSQVKPEIKKSQDMIQRKAKNKMTQAISVVKAGWLLHKMYSKIKPKKHLFFGSHIHRVRLGDEQFNRFYDPIVDYFDLKEDVVMIEYQKIHKNTFNMEAVMSLKEHLDNYKLLKKLPFGVQHSVTNSAFESYHHFLEALAPLVERLDTLRLSIDQLEKWVLKVEGVQGFFEKLFRKMRPEHIVFQGYYGLDDLYAAMLTANTMGIETIDMQHGPQTEVHMVFSAWTKFPKESYSLMPVTYWNWDETSKLNIEAWSHAQERITAKVIGQPWVGYWLAKNANQSFDRAYIFFSLQTHPFTLEEMITPAIIECMRQTSQPWLLRLHPRNHIPVSEIRQYITDHGILESKFTIQDAFEMPLPESLLRSFIHITNFSGCLIEAYLLGIPTIVIHEVGLEVFAPYIDEKMVHYVHRDIVDFVARIQILINEKAMLEPTQSSAILLNPFTA